MGRDAFAYPRVLQALASDTSRDPGVLGRCPWQRRLCRVRTQLGHAEQDLSQTLLLAALLLRF